MIVLYVADSVAVLKRTSIYEAKIILEVKANDRTISTEEHHQVRTRTEDFTSTDDEPFAISASGSLVITPGKYYIWTIQLPSD